MYTLIQPPEQSGVFLCPLREGADTLYNENHREKENYEVNMARKKNKRSKQAKPSDLASVEATAKKLQSYLTMPDMWQLSRGGTFQGIRKKLLTIDFQTIRNVVDKVPIINAIIQTRIDQVKPFLRYTEEKGEEGYHFVMRDPREDPNKEDEKLFFQLAEFFDQTGLVYDATREDDFHDYVEMMVRETMVIDQIATEIQRNRKGETIAFWALDGATIQRVDPKIASKHTMVNMEGQRVQVGAKDRFVQIVEDRITNTYADDHSAVEQCIDLITTLLFGYNYLRDQMMRDRVPKGFIQVMGDVGKEQLDGIREYWYAAMSGAGGTWNIPIVPSGKDGVGIDWKNIQPNNRDMEYHKSMMFITSIVSAVFGMDPAEMGIKTDDSTALIGENSEPRISASKDRGLASMLMFIEQHVNKILRKVNEKYKFEFVGLKKDDELKLADLRKKSVESYMTVNELRIADGLPELDDDYANVVLNPQAVQIYQSAQMQEQGGGEGEYGEGMPEGDEGDDSENLENPQGDTEDSGADVDWEGMFKSMTSGKDVKVVIK